MVLAANDEGIDQQAYTKDRITYHSLDSHIINNTMYTISNTQ